MTDHLSVVVAILGVFVAIFVAIVSYVGQNTILILSQLTEKGKECNSYLQDSNFQIYYRDITQISNILTTVITAIQLLDYNRNRNKILRKMISRQQCLDQFYLLLHPSIRLFFCGDTESRAKLLNSYFNDKTIEQQFLDSCNNLKESASKYQ